MGACSLVILRVGICFEAPVHREHFSSVPVNGMGVVINTQCNVMSFDTAEK